MNEKREKMQEEGMVASRRKALKFIGAAAGAGLLLPRSALAAPTVRKKVKLTYWTFSDNPTHRKLLVDAVDHFHRNQGFITIEMDATSRTQELHQKVAVAFAAGTAPDVATAPHYNVQQYYDNGVLYPVEDFFNKWDQKSDYYPFAREVMHVKPNQPALYLPLRMLGLILWYRADWFSEANLKPPATYDEFIAAAKAITRAPDRYGYALRGGDYYGVQVVEAIWGSAGVKFVDEATGKVDIDSPKAVEVAAKWLGMFAKDKSAQPTSVSDKYPQLFALMEQGKCGMWIYGTHGSPALSSKLGDRIQAVASPYVNKPCTEVAPTGDIIVSSSKEKEAAWEFLMSLGSAPSALNLGPGPLRSSLPVRKSIAADPVVKNNPHIKVATDQADNWWMPPMGWKHFQNFQDKIAPYWQEALRENISPKDLMGQAARLLRGEA